MTRVDAIDTHVDQTDIWQSPPILPYYATIWRCVSCVISLIYRQCGTQDAKSKVIFDPPNSMRIWHWRPRRAIRLSNEY
jgi:hypothetical protein